MDEEIIKRKEVRRKRDVVMRDFRLKNLKRAADKNKALHKYAKKSMKQSCVISVACIIFGIAFVFIKSSGVSRIVENSLIGFGSLLGLLTKVKEAMTSSSDDDDTTIK